MRFDMTIAQAMLVASQVALGLAVSVLLGFLAGSYLDSRFSTTPLLTLAGSLTGMMAGAYSAVRLLQTLARKQSGKRPPGH